MENPPLTYSHRPKPFSNELDLRLTGTELIAERGRSRQAYPLEKLERIRLSFKPRNIARLAFTCEVRARDGNSVTFNNISWKSLIDIDRPNAAYRAMVSTLIERAAKANPAIRLEAGIAPLRYRVMQGLGVVLATGLAAMVYLAFQNAAYTIAVFALGLGAYLYFWLGDFLRRNRPEAFPAGAIPERVLPPSVAPDHENRAAGVADDAGRV